MSDWPAGRIWRKLRENEAFGILLRPRVLANYRRYAVEFVQHPVVMRSLPPNIEIELTSRCNLACVQCLRSVGMKPYRLGDMDTTHYRRILDQFPYAVNIALNGFGEPTLYGPLFDVVEYTRRVRPWAKIGIYTNGVLMDDAWVTRAVRCGLTEIDVSIDAARSETYRRVRRGGELDVVHASVRRLLAARRAAGTRLPMVGLNYVMLNENAGELVAFVDQAKALGVDFINCISWAAYDWGFRNRRSPDSYLGELAEATARIDELGVRVKTFPDMNTRWTDPEKPFSCDFYWGNEFRVTWTGDVTLGCCTPFRETFTYGNLLEQPLEAIWNGPTIRRHREQALSHTPPTPTCESCDRFCKSFFDPARLRLEGPGAPQERQ